MNLIQWHKNYASLAVLIYFFFSMGGAIAVHVAVQKLLPSLAGLAVIDVVEGKEIYTIDT